jgi:hypothetical protein
MLKTVKEIAAALNLSEIRIRQYLAMPGAPMPVIQPRNIYKGKAPGKYDLDEMQAFIAANRRKPGRPYGTALDYWRSL